MLHHTPRASLALACLAYLGILMAEVSDKEPIAVLFWQVGIDAALICLLTARFKPWLGRNLLCPCGKLVRQPVPGTSLARRQPVSTIGTRQRLLPASVRGIRTRRLRTRRRLSLAQTHIFLTSRHYEPIRRKKSGTPQGAAFTNNLRDHSPSLCCSTEACAVCWSSIACSSAAILAFSCCSSV